MVPTLAKDFIDVDAATEGNAFHAAQVTRRDSWLFDPHPFSPFVALEEQHEGTGTVSPS